MWRDQYKTMLKACICTFLFFALSAQPAFARTDAKAAADKLAHMLGEAHEVSFYILSRTGQYSFRPDEFREQASIRIVRECGNDCKEFMMNIIRHVDKSVSTKCLPGQQNILIDVGTDYSILFSYSGRMVKIDGSCYFNKESANRIIESSKFLFN